MSAGGIPIEPFVMRSLLGEVEPNEPLYVLERGDPDRSINGQNPSTVQATETTIPVYSDPALAVEVTQPITANDEGRYPYWIAADSGDFYSPNDVVDPIQPFERPPGWVWSKGGLLVSVPRDYVPPFDFEGDAVFGDFFGFGPEPGRKASGAGGSGLVGRAGPAHIDRISMRFSAQTALSATSVGDNPQIRSRQAPGWGHAYPTPGEGVIRRRPLGASTWVGTPAAPGATEVFIFPAKSYPAFFDDTVPNVSFIVDGQECTYDSKSSRTAWLSGDTAAGATEITVAIIQDAGFPSEGYFRIRSQQVYYDTVTQILDAGADGIHKAGATTFVAKNVSAAEWDAIPQTAGAIRVTRAIGGSRSFKYTAASYEAGTEKVTFTLDANTKLDKNVLNGGGVTMHKLSGLESDFVHFVEGAEIGDDTLTLGVTIDGDRLGLVHPYSRTAVDQADIDKIPSSGTLRVEVLDDNPAGPGQVDFPTVELDYDDFDHATGVVTLSDPLTASIPTNSLIELPGCSGFFRDRSNGQQLTIHVLGGVSGLDAGASVGGVVQYSPRYGQPCNPSMHFAMDHWEGASGWKGYAALIGGSRVQEGSGDTAPGSKFTHMFTVPDSGVRWQKFVTAAIGIAPLGAGVRGTDDIEHNFHAGDYYTRVKPPNIELDCDCDPDDIDCDCEEDEESSEGGAILTGTINVATVIGLEDAVPTRIKVNVHNRETATEKVRELDVTGASETGGAIANPVLTGITFDQTSQGPKVTLNGNHVLASITAIVANESVTDFPLPATGHAGKWRAVASLGGTILATGTYTSRTGTTLSGVVVSSGTGTLPSGTIIEENYSIGDFWVDSGAEISLADSVRTAAIGSATNIKSGTDRPDASVVEIGVVGDDSEPGVAIGDAELLRDDDDDLEWAGDKLATRDYADLIAQGIKWKESARAATTANITLANVQTIDGVSVVAGDRVLVKNQTDLTQNGIYVVAAGSGWARAADANTGSELELAWIGVTEGTEHANDLFQQSTDPVTIGTSDIVWEVRLNLTDLAAGDGLIRTGSILAVGAGTGIIANADDIEADFGTGAGKVTEGDDARLPTADEKAALAGTEGTPAAANAYVTDEDPRNADARTPTDGSVTAAKLGVLPAARVRRSTAQTIATATQTKLAFDTEDHDTAALHDTATNNTRLTAPVAGIYAIGARVSWVANATGVRQISLRLNDTTLLARIAQDTTASAFPQQLDDQYVLAAGDFVEIQVNQTSGGNLDMDVNAPRNPVFYMRYVGASS